MIHVLIVMMVGTGAATAGIEFSTKAACEEAGKAVAARVAEYGSGRSALWVCAPKG